MHFDDLEQWGQALGLRTELRTTQSEFLRPFAQQTKNDQYLTNEDGAGSAFEVLLQEKAAPFTDVKSPV